MSKSRRRIRMVHFENHAFYFHEKSFSKAFRFMKLEIDGGGNVIYFIAYKDLLVRILADGSICYCDETWDLLHLKDITRKVYTWIIGNSKANVVVYYYKLDNNLCERAARQYALFRKTSIHTASHRGARVRTILRSLVETCKLEGISIVQYFTAFFKAVCSGRTDYEILLPATINLNA